MSKLSSQSLHDVLLTLIILWWIFFMSIFFLEIYGIKCTGSVSSSLWIEMLSLASFSFLSWFLHIREGIAFNCVVILLWHQQLAQQHLDSNHCWWGDNWEGGVMGRVRRRKKKHFTNKQGDGISSVCLFNHFTLSKY